MIIVLAIMFAIPTVTYVACKDSYTYCGETRCKTIIEKRDSK